jgi:hypothetical protein
MTIWHWKPRLPAIAISSSPSINGTFQTALDWNSLFDTQRIPYTVEGIAMKNIQLPDDVYKRAAELAESDHVSVDRLVAALVNEGVGDWSRVQARAARGSIEKLKRVLSKVSDAPPESGDQL